MAIDRTAYTATKHTGIKIHNDGLKFWFDYKVNNKRYSKLWSANAAHGKADRLKTAYNALEAFKQVQMDQDNSTADMDATVATYWDKLKIIKNWKPEHKKKYQLFYERYLEDIGSMKVIDVKPSHLTNVNISMKHLSTRTQKRAYEILVPLFELAIEDELLLRSPIKKSHIPIRNQLSEMKIITDAEAKYRLVYKAINDTFADNPHHKAIFLFGFHGRRIGETLKLTWEDINFDNNTYIIRGENSKINTDMTFALHEDIKQALMQFKDLSGGIFNVKEVEHHYASIRKATGIKEFTFHWMRNLSVSALSAMGADATHLSAMLGHNDLNTLKKYLSLQRTSSTAILNDMTNKLLS